MKREATLRLAFAGISLLAIPTIGLFYIRYVPLVRPFQTALLPILLAVFLTALVRPVWGILLFIFAFPLINSLPYFFGLAEPLPQAPTALVLCLFYLLALLLRGIIAGPILPSSHPIFRPMVLFAGLVMVSALITFLRYANFFPLLSDRIYELCSNLHRVSSGGAIMSVVFTALSYLTGLGFFLAVITSLNSMADIRMAIGILGASTGLSLLMALYQQVLNPKFGNNPISIRQALINGTFKDALSFGAYLAIAAPLFLGAAFWYRKRMRLICLGLFGLSGFIILFSGSISGLLALVMALIFWGIIWASRLGRPKGGFEKVEQRRKKIPAVSWAVGLIIVGGLAWVGNAHKETIVKMISGSRSVVRLKSRSSNFSLKIILSGRVDAHWPLAGAMIRDYPVTGVGVGGYIIEMSNYAKDKNVIIEIPESAENSALQIGSELGLVGLLVAAWIFWEIVKQIGRQFRFVGKSPRDRYLLIGLTAGIFSFVLISFVHTFIWSYEIKYTLWLLVGLLFCLGQADDGQRDDVSDERRRFGKKSWIIGLGLVFLYSSVLLWNSTHSLSLESRAAKYGFKQDFGFYQKEKTVDGREFRWTGRSAGMELLIEKAGLNIPLHASHPDVQQRPVRIKVYLVKRLFKEKRLLGEIWIRDTNWKTYEFAVSPEEVGRNAILLLKVDRTWVPQKALGVPDPRCLGVALGSTYFKDLKT
jgi:hypothetical protein